VQADPRTQMQELVQRAMSRNKGLDAATLMAQAARDDWEEARAARLPTVNANATLANAGTKTQGFPVLNGLSSSGTLNASMPIWDGGRINKLTAWRVQLAEAARQGLISAEQQIALQTVSLALDRSRYQLQIRVYGQYVRKMGCLVDALETVVQADRGRASELVQAQKSRAQAELSVDQTRAALRQTEVRLKRYVGDDLPPSASYAALLPQVPDLTQMQEDAVRAADILQLDAQARGQVQFADSVAAQRLPQVGVVVSAGGTDSPAKSANWVAGVSVNVPIFTPGLGSSIDAARKRAEATRLQRDDALETRRYRMAEMHEMAVSSYDRARQVVEILRSSDHLRNATMLQWQQLGRRSLFDVMGAEADYYGLRVAQVNALFDAQQAVALLWSLGRGVMTPLR
jgi:adhesin transport system outer membrane protein